MIKAVLFDLDGVLVDACDWHYNALNKALEKFGHLPISREDHESKFNGLPTRTKLEKLSIPAHRIPQIEELKQQYTIEEIQANCVVDESKVHLFKYLTSCNIFVGIVTNCSETTAELMLNKIGVMGLYNELVHNKVAVYNKPYPDPYFFAMARLGVQPQECLIIEDSPKGIQSAKMSGANYCSVENALEVTRELLEPIIEAINIYPTEIKHP